MVPLRLSVPVPVLVRPPLPLITPAYAPGAVLPFNVSVLPPRATLPPLVPAPDKALIVWSAPRLRIALAMLAITTPLLVAIALLVAVVRLSVPALTVVAPLYKWVVDNTRVPLPLLVIPKVPLPSSITPPRFSVRDALATSKVLLAPSVIAPLNVASLPALLLISLPPLSVRPGVPATVSPLMSSTPLAAAVTPLVEPSPPALPSFSVPLVRVVAPA